jgi:hypothetical protein
LKTVQLSCGICYTLCCISAFKIAIPCTHLRQASNCDAPQPPDAVDPEAAAVTMKDLFEDEEEVDCDMGGADEGTAGEVPEPPADTDSEVVMLNCDICKQSSNDLCDYNCRCCLLFVVAAQLCVSVFVVVRVLLI